MEINTWSRVDREYSKDRSGIYIGTVDLEENEARRAIFILRYVLPWMIYEFSHEFISVCIMERRLIGVHGVQNDIFRCQVGGTITLHNILMTRIDDHNDRKKLNLYSTRRNTQDLRVFLAPAHSAANNSRERVKREKRVTHICYWYDSVINWWYWYHIAPYAKIESGYLCPLCKKAGEYLFQKHLKIETNLTKFVFFVGSGFSENRACNDKGNSAYNGFVICCYGVEVANKHSGNYGDVLAMSKDASDINRK